MSDDSVHVSKHAADRAKERLDWPRRAVERMAQVALEKGLRHGDLTGKLARFADGLYLDRNSGVLVVHGEVAFTFSPDHCKLITVYRLDNDLAHAAVAIARRTATTDEGGVI